MKRRFRECNSPKATQPRSQARAIPCPLGGSQAPFGFYQSCMASGAGAVFLSSPWQEPLLFVCTVLPPTHAPGFPTSVPQLRPSLGLSSSPCPNAQHSGSSSEHRALIPAGFPLCESVLSRPSETQLLWEGPGLLPCIPTEPARSGQPCCSLQ